MYDHFALAVGASLRRRAILDCSAEGSRENVEQARADAVASGHRYAIEAETRPARATPRSMRVVGETVREAGRAVRLFGLKRDVTAEREAWSRLRRFVECDAVVRYRATVDDDLRRGGVSGLTRVARMGHDDFAALFEARLSPAASAGALDRPVAAPSRPILWNGRRIGLCASIGAIRLHHPHRRMIPRVLAEADEALCSAKSAGRNSVRIYREDRTSGSDVRGRPIPALGAKSSARRI